MYRVELDLECESDMGEQMILVINTSGPGLEFVLDDKYKHVDTDKQSVALACDAEKFIHECGAKWSDITAIGVIVGPGSFTGIRLGIACAHPEVIAILNKIKYPYNVNLLTQREALHMLQQPLQVQQWVGVLLKERERLMEAFAGLPCCLQVYPTDANFFLAKVTDANGIYARLVEQGIIVRNRSHITLCDNCLRITVGTSEENDALLEALSHEAV